jgi:hypothetical protein
MTSDEFENDEANSCAPGEDGMKEPKVGRE